MKHFAALGAEVERSVGRSQRELGEMENYLNWADDVISRQQAASQSPAPGGRARRVDAGIVVSPTKPRRKLRMPPSSDWHHPSPPLASDGLRRAEAGPGRQGSGAQPAAKSCASPAPADTPSAWPPSRPACSDAAAYPGSSGRITMSAGSDKASLFDEVPEDIRPCEVEEARRQPVRAPGAAAERPGDAAAPAAWQQPPPAQEFHRQPPAPARLRARGGECKIAQPRHGAADTGVVIAADRLQRFQQVRRQLRTVKSAPGCLPVAPAFPRI
eukprot:TRINITY_DN38365_c0_g1_i3.p1 TRINITY_DN38365_c0_g1~~TRINITY_DN38365_c0_g1_i3.p1  ORF type:complete len:271 (+),score=52.44 TRINITY_DN38365_c0_g1_i3:310-1122(+)